MSKFLYELINGLTTSEKIYFKRSASTHAKKDNKNYLKVYDTFEQLDNPDDEVLSGLFKGTAIDKYRQSEFNYLTERLLLSLFNFDLNGSKRNQIQKGILLAEVLTKRGFRKQALKKLTAIKKNAVKYEELTMLLRIIELEEITLFKEGVIGYKDKLQELKEQRTLVTAKIQNLNDYHILREEIREAQFTGALNINDFKPFEEICNNPLVQSNEHCMTIKAKEHWYYTQVLMNYLKWDFHAGLDLSYNYVMFLLQNTHLFSTSRMLPVISNFIYHAALTKNRSSFDLGQNLLLEIADKDNISVPYLRYIQYTRSLEFAYYYGYDLALMEEYLPLTADLLTENEEKFEESQVQYLYMVVVRANIVLGQFKKGSLLINRWMQTGVLPYRKVQARLFLLIIHFELGYFDLLQSEILPLKKLEKTHLRDQLLISAFYSFFNTLIAHPNRKDQLIETLQETLKSISVENSGYFDFIAFDYYKWSLGLTKD